MAGLGVGALGNFFPQRGVARHGVQARQRLGEVFLFGQSVPQGFGDGQVIPDHGPVAAHEDGQIFEGEYESLAVADRARIDRPRPLTGQRLELAIAGLADHRQELPD